MTRIVLIRHGQTEWNKVDRFRGRADLELNEAGASQAEALACRLASWPIAAVYSSPSRRAMQTARPVAQRLGIEVRPDNDLIDIDFGSWQGLSLEEAAAKDGALCKQWIDNPHLVKFPHGESLGDVRSRVDSLLRRVLVEHPQQTVALVSHKVVCKVLVCSIIGADNSHFWQVEQDVAAISTFLPNVDGSRMVVGSLNDTCHLEALKS